jgi:hypothetical protein
VLADLRAKGPLLVVDGGGSLAPPSKPPRPGSVQPALPDKTGEIEQRRIKAELIASAYALGGLDAMALSAGDWALGSAFVRELAKEHQLPVLAANLTCGGQEPFPGGRVLEQGGHKVGVVGITLGTVEGCEVSDPADAVRAAVAELGEVDVVLGLFPYDNDRAAAELWTTALPVQLVLDARGRSVERAEPHESSLWLSGASRGKSIGVAQLSFAEGSDDWVVPGGEEELRKQLAAAETRLAGVTERMASPEPDQDLEALRKQQAAQEARVTKLSAQLAALEHVDRSNRIELQSIELDDSLSDHGATQKLVEAAKDKITGLAPFDPATFVPRVVQDTSSPFVGGEACVGCHKEQHAQWSTTAHARAWQSLVQDKRAMDGDCWSCHVTGASAEGGPTHPADAGGFRDVQCEACHGPGRAHMASPADKALILRDPPQEDCTRCHDGDKDGGRFNFGAYRPQIVHQTP